MRRSGGASKIHIPTRAGLVGRAAGRGRPALRPSSNRRLLVAVMKEALCLALVSNDFLASQGSGGGREHVGCSRAFVILQLPRVSVGYRGCWKRME